MSRFESLNKYEQTENQTWNKGEAPVLWVDSRRGGGPRPERTAKSIPLHLGLHACLPYLPYSSASS